VSSWSTGTMKKWKSATNGLPTQCLRGVSLDIEGDGFVQVRVKGPMNRLRFFLVSINRMSGLEGSYARERKQRW